MTDDNKLTEKQLEILKSKIRKGGGCCKVKKLSDEDLDKVAGGGIVGNLMECDNMQFACNSRIDNLCDCYYSRIGSCCIHSSYNCPYQDDPGCKFY